MASPMTTRCRCPTTDAQTKKSPEDSGLFHERWIYLAASTTPEPEVDPVLDPDSPMRDPLARPNVLTPEVSPEPSSGDGIPDDDKMPLPND